MKQVVVVGAGIIGLSSAIELQRVGYQVTIWAKDLPPNTTSNVAPAIWYPYYASPEEKVRIWGGRTLERFIAQCDDPSSGVRLVQGKKLFSRPMGKPWWHKQAPLFRLMNEYEMVSGHVSGYEFKIPIVDMSVYLEKFLIPQYTKAGGILIQREITNLNEALDAFSCVVNCTGLGSIDLCGDKSLFPIRGQTVRVEAMAEPQFIMDTDNPKNVTYIFPRLSECVMGGVAQEGDWNAEPDEATTVAIRARCAAYLPEVSGLALKGIAVGFRPGRESIRLEKENLGGTYQKRTLIHNYGHGGSGVTLSWGCAEEVVQLATS